MTYPKFLYHATEAPKVVADATEHAAHTALGWVESPADLAEAAAEKAVVAVAKKAAPKVKQVAKAAADAAVEAGVDAAGAALSNLGAFQG